MNINESGTQARLTNQQ